MSRHENPSPGAWRVVVAESADALAPHVAAWDALAEDCLEPNPFYESWMLLPAIRAFGESVALVVVLIYKDSDNGDSRLCGFFPFERVVSRRPFGAILTLWRHLHCFCCNPLIRRDAAAACLGELMHWARSDRCGAPLMRWELVSAEGPLAEALDDHLRRRRSPSIVESHYQRAFWRRRATNETYLEEAFSSRGRQDFRRKRKLLAKMGALEFRTLERGSPENSWIEQFLEIEASGWKGDKLTALATRPVERDYFLAIAEAAHRRGQLELLGLFLDGRPIAMKCHFRSGAGSFNFKPTYDETMSRFSPGALLELDHIEHCQGRRDIEWMDSCTSPDSYHYNRLWIDRLEIRTILFSSGSFAGNLLITARQCVRKLRSPARKTPNPNEPVSFASGPRRE